VKGYSPAGLGIVQYAASAALGKQYRECAGKYCRPGLHVRWRLGTVFAPVSRALHDDAMMQSL
jgi:hypothetical protein